jgi:hypothetical protein
MPPSETPKLPEANEFSPGQINLHKVLSLVNSHAGDRESIIEAIRVEYFLHSAAKRATPEERQQQQRTRAYNVIVGMKAYGLFDNATNELSDRGKTLLACPTDAEKYNLFAKHILNNCFGLETLEAVRDLISRNVAVSKDSLATELKARGFKLPNATTHHTKLLQWLREANVINKKYEIDEGKLKELSGLDFTAIDALAELTRHQLAFLRTLRKLAEAHGTNSLPAKAVVEQSIIENGSIFRSDQLRAQVFTPLENKGLIKTSGSGPGRGGKSGTVAATDELLEIELTHLLSEPLGDIPPELRAKLRTPLGEIYTNLNSSNTYEKGIALELLALRIIFDLGLIPLRFRERSAETGGAEVDLIAEGEHLHFSRWLFQCKNTAIVTLSSLAKEVGMAVLLKAHVIVIATTGRFASTVEKYANELAQTTPFQTVLLDGSILSQYKDKGISVLQEFFRAKAKQTMQLKRNQVTSA